MVHPVLFNYPRPAISEFLIALAPDARVSATTERSKEALEMCVGPYEARYSRPHFTLAQVTCIASYEAALIRAIEHHCIRRISPQLIQLSNFKKFDSSGTIYIDPVEKEFFRGIVRQLYYAIRSERLAARKYCHFTLEPHLTIGKKLKGVQLEMGWSLFSALTYQDAFFAEHIMLLKRADARTNRHELVHLFHLG